MAVGTDPPLAYLYKRVSRMSASCSNPTAVAGGTEITTGPYTHGTKVVYTCNTGYAMSGDPFVTCNNGAFTGTYPVCNLQDTNSVTVNLTDNDDDEIPNWIFYLIAALVGMIMFLILTCIVVWCCQLFGFYSEGGIFGSPSSESGCWCCRRKSYRTDRHESQPATYSYGASPRRDHSPDCSCEYSQLKKQCKAFPRRYLFDEHGRRFHFDDVGRACYYNHKHQNNKVVVTPASEESVITMNEDKKVAKEIAHAQWRPHMHPVRNNNTSTQ